MRWSRVALTSLCCLAACSLGAQSTLRNGGFEDGLPGEAPKGWSVSAGRGVKAETRSEGAAEGQNCAVVYLSEAPAEGAIANLIQTLDATPYRGKRVRLRAQLRVDKRLSQGHLWLRVDRPDHQQGFFDNTEYRPVRSEEWTSVEIVGDVETDAKVLALGAMLRKGGGKLWVDGVSLEVLGDTPSAPTEGPRPLSPSGLRNLLAFAKALGYVRFFHPSDEVASADWERVAQEGVRVVEGASSAGDLAQRLSKVLGPLAPTVQFRVSPTPPSPAKASGGAKQMVRWSHTGVGLSKSPTYWSTRVYVPLAKGGKGGGASDRSTLLALGAGVWVQLPLVCYVDKERRTLPHSGAVKVAVLPAPTVIAAPGDRASRLAGALQAWNVVQHFYPNFDLSPVDWPKALELALQESAESPTPEAYLLTMRRMMASLKDTHAWVSPLWSSPVAQPGLALTWVGQELVICGVDDALKDRVKLGEVLVSVEGVPVEKAVEALSPTLPASTPHGLRQREAESLLKGPPGALTLGIRGGDGAPRLIEVARKIQAPVPTEARPNVLTAELKPGIWYLDLERLTRERVAGTLTQVTEAKVIILDMRGYPVFGAWQELFQHFTDTAMETPAFMVPTPQWPDRRFLTFQRRSWWIQPAAQRLKARLIFLTDARAVSLAELLLDFVDHYKLGEIVGEATAGVDGDVNPFETGGLRYFWTGMKVNKHDGRPLDGVGYLPTVPVTRTLAGIREGRDEVLDKALEMALR